MSRSEDTRDRRIEKTWTRIFILLGLLVVAFFLPALWMVGRHFLGGEREMIRSVQTLDIDGEERFRFLRPGPDGRFTCAIRVPAPSWTDKVGYATEGAEHCEGDGVQPMPAEMSALAEEARQLRHDHGLWMMRLVDDDGDGRVDCAMWHRGARLYVDGASCARKKRSDAAPFDTQQRAAADRALAIENELRERWFDPLAESLQ